MSTSAGPLAGLCVLCLQYTRSQMLELPPSHVNINRFQGEFTFKNVRLLSFFILIMFDLTLLKVQIYTVIRCYAPKPENL